MASILPGDVSQIQILNSCFIEYVIDSFFNVNLLFNGEMSVLAGPTSSLKLSVVLGALLVQNILDDIFRTLQSVCRAGINIAMHTMVFIKQRV